MELYYFLAPSAMREYNVKHTVDAAVQSRHFIFGDRIRLPFYGSFRHPLKYCVGGYRSFSAVRTEVTVDLSSTKSILLAP